MNPSIEIIGALTLTGWGVGEFLGFVVNAYRKHPKRGTDRVTFPDRSWVEFDGSMQKPKPLDGPHDGGGDGVKPSKPLATDMPMTVPAPEPGILNGLLDTFLPIEEREARGRRFHVAHRIDPISGASIDIYMQDGHAMEYRDGKFYRTVARFPRPRRGSVDRVVNWQGQTVRYVDGQPEHHPSWVERGWN